MMKLQQSARCLMLPLLLPALSPSAWARTENSTAKTGAAKSSPLSRAQSLRSRARRLSQSARWQEAAAEWRSVLLELHRAERPNARTLSAPLDERDAQDAQIQEIRREAEREVRRAQSHLSAFWKVRDLVTPGVDSRNAVPMASPAAVGAAPVRFASAPSLSTVRSAAAMRAPLLSAAKRGAKPKLARNEVFAQGLMLDGTGQRATRNVHATVRWAQSQWWVQPLVQRSADSRNPMALSVSLAPLPSPPLLLARDGQRAAARRATAAPLFQDRASRLRVLVPALPASRAAATMSPRAEATFASNASLSAVSAGVSKAPETTPRSWTMRILLPGAREAALAARGALGSQP